MSLLLAFLINIAWTSVDDDELVSNVTAQYRQLCNDTLTERGLLNNFNYINYAFGTQDIYDGYGAENVDRMRSIKDQYDPEDVFGRLWKGGFKL
jgi:hypothetical protein